MEKLKEFVEEKIKKIVEAGITDNDITTLYKLVDIDKNLKKMEGYENMRYNERRNYMEGGYSEGYSARGRGRGRGRARDSQGRFRGLDESEEMFERMQEGYEGYQEGREEYRRTGYSGAKDEGMESLEYMLQSLVNFFEYVQDNTDSQEEMELVKKYAKKIKEM